jgi:outer membrane lipoprotein-sorting protein
MRTRISDATHRTGMARCLTLAALTLIALPLAAQSPEGLADAFAHIDKSAPQFRSLVADLTRDIHTAIINVDEKETGTIKVKVDKSHETRMLIDLTAPDAKTISIDSTRASIYYPKLKLVQDYNITGKKAVVDQFLLLGFGVSSAALKENYDVSFVGMEKVGAENSWHLQLVPKSKEVLQRLKKAELWISETSGLPLQQRFVTSATGDFNLATYSNLKINPNLSDGALKLKYPSGVKVEHPQL